MHIILCHITADFDTLGAAVGLTHLIPGARIVLTGGCHPAVRQFLALHRDEYALIERRAVRSSEIQSITVVDAHRRDRLGQAAEWLDLPHVVVTVYDHHDGDACDITSAELQIVAVGATCTIIAEQLQAQNVQLSRAEATVMALGIHVDTGSLTFEQATARDAKALAWLMEQGITPHVLADYVDPGLSLSLQGLLPLALEQLQTEDHDGYQLAWVILRTEQYVPGLSSLISRLMDLTDSHTLLLFHEHAAVSSAPMRLNIIGRSRRNVWSDQQGLDLAELFRPLGGGGHPAASAASLRGTAAEMRQVIESLVAATRSHMPQSPKAQDVMSAPVRTIRPETTIASAQRILLRYGHSGLSVVDDHDSLVGIISRRDLDIALHHGFSQAPVKGYMTTNLKTITPQTLISEVERLMMTYDIGRLPVLASDRLVGIVTRTDVLRQLHRQQNNQPRLEPDDDMAPAESHLPQVLWQRLAQGLLPELWEILAIAAAEAEQRGWHLYVVGGAVRDLLRVDPADPPLLADIDLVVDGFHQAAQSGAGIELATALQARYPETRLQIHGRFQTAALIWHKHPVFDSLMIDIATARTEFYPYPAANPEVEASSIGQDLYRRDFTINAMAIRLTSPRRGELLDFFGGCLDLQARQIRVLHPNSFIEDPTRIYRAVRFAVRLSFDLDEQTERYIRHALESGIYQQMQAQMAHVPALQMRLKNELKYILQAPYWLGALQLLADLGALQCIHRSLQGSDRLWRQLRLMDRWLSRFNRSGLISSWQMLLEVLLLHVVAAERGTVAAQLQLPVASIERLSQLDVIHDRLTHWLRPDLPPSQIVQALRPYDLEMLMLLSIESPRPLRHLIWRYCTDWMQVKPGLDGYDLRRLGYRPGPAFKAMLDEVLAATLDQKITTKAEAIAWLQTQYPLADLP